MCKVDMLTSRMCCVCRVEDVCRWNDPTMEKTPILQPMVVGIEGTQVLAKKSAKIQIPTFSVSGGISGLNVS